MILETLTLLDQKAKAASILQPLAAKLGEDTLGIAHKQQLIAYWLLQNSVALTNHQIS